MRNIKLTIQYDGSDYHGWQIQPGLATVQGEVAAAIGKLVGFDVQVNGASRTDAGVSALGQVANIRIDSPIPTGNLAKAITQKLAGEISISEAVEVDEDFDAIRSVKSKLYRYTIFVGENRPVLQIRHCWYRRGGLDIEKMKVAGGKLLGKNDFKSFACAADNRQSSVRTITQYDVRSEGDWIYFDVAADGFLYNMVRNIVGTLVEIGRGRWDVEKMDEILAAKDRNAAGPIAPASGLCLMWIEY